MNADNSLDYSRWLTLANDPSQSDAERGRYRALLKEHVHRQMRQAFGLAAESISSPTLPREPHL